MGVMLCLSQEAHGTDPLQTGHLNCLLRVMIFARFLYCKLSVFLFIINKNLMGDSLGLCK